MWILDQISEQVVQPERESNITILGIKCFSDVNCQNKVLTPNRHYANASTVVKLFPFRIKEIIKAVFFHTGVEDLSEIIRKGDFPCDHSDIIKKI